jgi:hypothetical protein
MCHARVGAGAAIIPNGLGLDWHVEKARFIAEHVEKKIFGTASADDAGSILCALGALCCGSRLRRIERRRPVINVPG